MGVKGRQNTATGIAAGSQILSAIIAGEYGAKMSQKEDERQRENNLMQMILGQSESESQSLSKRQVSQIDALRGLLGGR